MSSVSPPRAGKRPRLAGRIAAQFEEFPDLVILRDFSPEEPALSEVEGISRASAQLWASRICASRQMLRKLSMTPWIKEQDLN